ncbi:MAG TPA: dehydrogenase [Chloroflexi bacterium]|nr:dehydrogenase [Chloroflexota bacterium]
MAELNVVGKPAPRKDGYAKVTGTATFFADVQLPGMLEAKLLLSPHPHARIVSIDTSKAEALPGVYAVLTYKNIPDIYAHTSSQHKTERRILDSTLRFVGQEVAAVAAEDDDVAEEALDLIEVKYELLPHVLDPEEAMRSGAPQLHQHAPNNIVGGKPTIYERGDIEQGFQEADQIFEQTYRTQRIHNVVWEPRGATAMWEGDTLILWTSTQGHYGVQQDVAEDLGLPVSKVRVIAEHVGGGFGGQTMGYPHQTIAALLARKTGRPVRLRFSRRDDFLLMHGRWPTIQTVKMGVKNDGTLTAISAKQITDGGAYLKASPTNMFGVYRDGPNCPHMRLEGYGVYTNSFTSGNMRMVGGPMGQWSLDSIMDEACDAMGWDKVDFLLKNLSFDVHSESGLPRSSTGLRDAILQAAERFGWYEKKKTYPLINGSKRRGIGVGFVVSMGGYVPFYSNAAVRVHQDGSVTVLHGATDIGQGAKTATAQIAAEALGVRYEDVEVIHGDTFTSPPGPPASAHRTLIIGGPVVLEAALDARRQLLEIAAEKLEVKPEDLDTAEGRIFVKDASDKGMTFGEAVRAREYTWVVGNGHFKRQTQYASFDGGVVFAEVEVDIETGQANIVKLVQSHDVGKAINPLILQGQAFGALIQAAGYVLSEEMHADAATGIYLNSNIHEFKMLTIRDIPDMELILVEPGDAVGPFGAHGAVESFIQPPVPAIGSAVCQAIGVRIRDLPITSNKILKALKQA